MNQLFQGIIKQKEVVDIKNYFEDEKKVKEYTCSHCGYEQDDIDLDDDVVCKSCGTLYRPNIDSSAEYRFFGAEDRSSLDPCRVGAPIDIRFPHSTLGTIILNKTTGGNKSNRIAMARVRRFHTWNLLDRKSVV